MNEIDVLTPQEIAKLLKVSPAQVRKIFQDRKGVLTMQSQKTRGTRSYTTIRVPRQVFDQYYAERTR